MKERRQRIRERDTDKMERQQEREKGDRVIKIRRDRKGVRDVEKEQIVVLLFVRQAVEPLFAR